jgi:hypothetical protein
VHNDKLETFKELCTKFVEKTNDESKCLYYGFSFDEDQAHCREGYKDAEGVLTHLENIGSLFEEALTIADYFSVPLGGLANIQDFKVAAYLCSGIWMLVYHFILKGMII